MVGVDIEIIKYRRLAQLVERRPYKADVVGSIPAPPTIYSFNSLSYILFIKFLFSRFCIEKIFTNIIITTSPDSKINEVMMNI